MPGDPASVTFSPADKVNSDGTRALSDLDLADMAVDTGALQFFDLENELAIRPA